MGERYYICICLGPGPKGQKINAGISLCLISKHLQRYNINNYKKILVLSNDVLPCGFKQHLHSFLPLLPR